jgi:hypothetical protein
MVSRKFVSQMTSTSSWYIEPLPGDEEENLASSGGKYWSFTLEQLKLEKANSDRNKVNDNKNHGVLRV